MVAGMPPTYAVERRLAKLFTHRMTEDLEWIAVPMIQGSGASHGVCVAGMEPS